MAQLTKKALIDLALDALADSGWGIACLTNAGTHPARFTMKKAEVEHTVRLYIWNLSHGGRTRSEEEFRIQITGVARFEPEPAGQTVILGWGEGFGVFAGFDAQRRLGSFGASPSIQIRSTTLQAAEVAGAATQDKGDGEYAIGLRPDKLGLYIQHLEEAHAGNIDTILMHSDAPHQTLDEIPENEERQLSETMESGETVREEYFESFATGVEVETQDPLPPEEPEPWDPEKIRIHTKHYSLRQVVDMIAEGDIDLAPDFQRQYVWKPPQRSGLIESLLLGIPLPSFYLNEDPTGRLQVVDGVQRLTTIYRYATDQTFKLGKVTYLHELEGQGFDDLATLFRRRLNSTQFVAHVIDPQTPYRVKFDIFRRINTGGSPLSAQEIRHCMSKTLSREFLKELVSDQSFVTATGGALQNHPRMADREVALRFVAFRLFTSDEYAQHDSFDEFLGFVTDRLDASTSENLDQVRTDFVRGMTNCYLVFGEHAFRKWPLDATRKSPINRALFESWGTVLADYSETVVRGGAEELLKRAREMMTTDFEFVNSISGSTGDVRNVRTRLGKVRAVASEVLR